MSDFTRDPFTFWNFLVQLLAALGTLGAIMVAIWGDWFRSKFAAPKLSIELKDALGVLGKSADGRQAIYYHLRVSNSRHWAVARKCRVLLREVFHKRPDQQFYPVEMPVLVPFFWAPRGSSPLELDVAREAILDFGSVIEKDTFFAPSLAIILASTDTQVRANQPRRYALELTAEAYSSSRTCVFEVAWDGYWTADLQEMSKHLVVREISREMA
jgi:hypothetical protein